MSARVPVCMDCGAVLPPAYPSRLCARCLWAGEAAAESPAPQSSGVSAMRVPGHEVLAEIARGGMGVVYRARERESQRTVALKMLRPRLADEQGMRERFRQEARAVAALEHPGILPVYRVDETDDLPFFTMKLAAGGTLAERRAEYAGQWRDIAALMVSLCDAVQYAHQHGVLHRDLKPLNVLFDDAGRAYLTDFGLAKLVDSVSELTGSLTYLGTPSASNGV
jgi:eukaryotic-like serine/threonine-protein kinase